MIYCKFRDIYQVQDRWHPVCQKNVDAVHLELWLLVRTMKWNCESCESSPANPSYTKDELAHQLRETKAKVLVAHSSNVDTAFEAADIVGLARSSIFVFGKGIVKGVRPYVKVLLGGRLARTVEFKFEKSLRKSKGVMTTYNTAIRNNITAIWSPTSESEAARILAVLPFFHIYGLMVVLHAPFYMQRPVYILPRFDLEQFCTTVQKYKISFGCVVPPILLLLAKSPAIDKYDLSSLKVVVSGAAPLDAALADEVQKRLNLKVKQAYGLTETTPVVCIQPNNNIVPGSSGVLVPDMFAKVVDAENGKEMGVGERGELWLKGPNIMKGYLNRPKETANCIDSEGYFHTGDVAIIDSAGHIYIVDRIKELIKYKGFQVAPAELEGILLKYADVADCAVIGLYDHEQVTEIPRAYIVLRPGVQQGEKVAEDLKKFVADKQIQSVIFRDQIPKSATVKILRNVLRNEVKAEEDAKRASKL
ncbi:hypothetical protein BDB00DRAFT_884743 [Zychaea mexicana]|uniref:uncharacterized protein n=1 Tax=Zychaea mexicana TaxID=64656 RepID=UPI0022FE0C84|nr:uncharacterized protein BDB00DRAFT_884743 [Zychaea mexicana]KAI9488768.1 hypothetical protein BDB00DRAFT_884743 [Zychaea mexicana]